MRPLLLLVSTLFLFFLDGKATDFFEVQDGTTKFQKADSSTQRYVRIDKIFIIGNKRTKPQIILRELDIAEGDVFYLPDLKEVLKADENKIFNTRLFNSVDIHLLEIDAYIADIIIEVKERWYTFPIPIFSLADRNFNDWVQNQNAKLDRVNYGIKFYQHNVRGRNERLRGIVQFGFTKKFELSYRIPYIDQAQKNGLTLFGGYEDNKSIAFQTTENKLVFAESENILRETANGGLTFTRRSNFYTTHSFSASYWTNKIADTVAVLNQNYFSDGQTKQQYFQLNYTLNRDKRDIQAYPLNGYQLLIQASQAGLGIFNDLSQTDLRTNYGKYIALGKNYYFSTSLTGRTTFPQELPYYNYQALGYGRDYIRGYELYVIEGQQYIINKLTLKKRLLDGIINIENILNIDQFKNIPVAIYFKTFFDSGYVRDKHYYPESALLTNKYLFGGGVGLDIVSFYDSVIRLEYSINRQAEHGFFFHFIADI